MMITRLKLEKFDIKLIIDAFNAKRLKEKAKGLDCSHTSNLILKFIDAYEA